MMITPGTIAMIIRIKTANVGCTVSLLQTIPSGVVDQIITTAKYTTEIGKNIPLGLKIK